MDLWKTLSFKNSFTRSLIFIVLIFSCLRFAPFYNCFSSTGFLIVTAEEEYVQGNFSSIQEAINCAENGSTIYVPSDVYYEQIVINKTISLIDDNSC
jgi:pectin methylesterase-like acyl-CoA thioesterase